MGLSILLMFCCLIKLCYVYIYVKNVDENFTTKFSGPPRSMAPGMPMPGAPIPGMPPGAPPPGMHLQVSGICFSLSSTAAIKFLYCTKSLTKIHFQFLLEDPI